MNNDQRPFFLPNSVRMSHVACFAAGLIALTLSLLCLANAVQAGEPQVLTIRPEKVREATGQKNLTQPPARDPFNLGHDQISLLKKQEPREKSNSIAGLTISGIIWDKNRPQAVINGRLIAKGEVINDSLIKQIQKDLVVFEQNGISYTLWLESSPRPLPLKDKKL